MKIFCDASGWNGIRSMVGVRKGQKNITVSFEESFTVNKLEYFAVILGCMIADNGDEVVSDSQLVVQQIKGEYKVKNVGLFPLAQAAKELIKGKVLKLDWIPRMINRADKLI